VGEAAIRRKTTERRGCAENHRGFIDMRRIVRISLGVVLILLGIPGLVLPVLQGWLFLALGALLLSVDLTFFDRLVRWIEEKVPPVKKPLEKVRNYLKDSKKPDKGK
jgi:uncharacterized protein